MALWLEELWQENVARARRSEASFRAHYERHRKPSQSWGLMRSGSWVELSQECVALDGALGVDERSVAGLCFFAPSIDGGCGLECEASSRCPFHRKSSLWAELAMELFQQAARRCVLELPEVVMVGRRGTVFDFERWYLERRGQDWGKADWERFEGDPLAVGLALLGRRAAVWGWGDGGYGEGLLGWLGPEECGVWMEAWRARGPDLGEVDGRMAVMMERVSGMIGACFEAGCGVVLLRS